MEAVKQKAEQLRHEPYRMFKNNCYHKSMELRNYARQLGIPAYVVVCFGTGHMSILSRRILMPIIHAWAYVNGERFEVSRPKGEPGVLGFSRWDMRIVCSFWV